MNETFHLKDRNGQDSFYKNNHTQFNNALSTKYTFNFKDTKRLKVRRSNNMQIDSKEKSSHTNSTKKIALKKKNPKTIHRNKARHFYSKNFSISRR